MSGIESEIDKKFVSETEMAAVEQRLIDLQARIDVIEEESQDVDHEIASKDVVRVEDFGVKPDSTNDYHDELIAAAKQATADLNRPHKLVFGNGFWNIYQTLPLSLKLLWEGQGTWQTRLRYFNAVDAFYPTYLPDPSRLDKVAQYGGVRKMAIDLVANIAGNTATAINGLRICRNDFDDLFIENFDRGLVIDGQRVQLPSGGWRHGAILNRGRNITINQQRRADKPMYSRGLLLTGTPIGEGDGRAEVNHFSMVRCQGELAKTKPSNVEVNIDFDSGQGNGISHYYTSGGVYGARFNDKGCSLHSGYGQIHTGRHVMFTERSHDNSFFGAGTFADGPAFADALQDDGQRNKWHLVNLGSNF